MKLTEDWEIAYEAYRAHTGGISLASGQKIPEAAELRPDIQEAWKASAAALRDALFCPVHGSLDRRGELAPFDNCIGCMRVQLDELQRELRQIEACVENDDCGELPLVERVSSVVSGLVEVLGKYINTKEAGEALVSSILSVRQQNTTEWMEGIAEDINSYAESTGEPDRARFNGDGLSIVTAAQERAESEARGKTVMLGGPNG